MANNSLGDFFAQFEEEANQHIAEESKTNEHMRKGVEEHGLETVKTQAQTTTKEQITEAIGYMSEDIEKMTAKPQSKQQIQPKTSKPQQIQPQEKPKMKIGGKGGLSIKPKSGQTKHASSNQSNCNIKDSQPKPKIGGIKLGHKPKVEKSGEMIDLFVGEEPKPVQNTKQTQQIQSNSSQNVKDEFGIFGEPPIEVEKEYKSNGDKQPIITEHKDVFNPDGPFIPEKNIKEAISLGETIQEAKQIQQEPQQSIPKSGQDRQDAIRQRIQQVQQEQWQPFNANKHFTEKDLENPLYTPEQRQYVINRLSQNAMEDQLQAELEYSKVEEELRGEELAEELFKRSETPIMFKEKWMEMYHKAINSNKKGVIQRKLSNGKFRFNEDGVQEIMPDMETYGLTSNEMFSRQWSI